MARTSTWAGSGSVGGGYGAEGVAITKMYYQCKECMEPQLWPEAYRLRGLGSCKRHNHQCWHLWRGFNFNLGGKCTYWWWRCRITVTDAGAISAFNNLASDGTSTLAGKMSVGSSYGNAGFTSTDARSSVQATIWLLMGPQPWQAACQL